MKRIGILTYHAAINFGANLQLFSTYCYLKRNGYEPIIINWVAEDLMALYNNNMKSEQVAMHKEFISSLEITSYCRNDKEIADAINNYNIDAIIIGSDAVVQHHTWRDNISFPSKKIISRIQRTSDTLYPNPFWGGFQKYLINKIPVAYLSASSQNSDYKNIDNNLKMLMCSSLVDNFVYYSVRDDWTRDMFSYITDGKVVPIVTPDPVFSVNQNIPTERIISKEEILNRYNLNSKYILLSFLNSHCVSQAWINRFVELANRDGFQCVAFPFPKGILFENSLEKKIDIPLPILDWYYLIKYASGYVGQNMHPVVVSLHNSVPFFSFDNYGITHFKLFVESRSSKIYHILNTAGFLGNRFEARNFIKKKPSPEIVYSKILDFDYKKCSEFSSYYHDLYDKNMESILKSLKDNIDGVQ